jgi:hypothetical protein
VSDTNRSCVGLLVVHGIGAQTPGETLDKLLRGLRLIDREVAPRHENGVVTAVVGGQRVRLYEVYWADLLLGDVTRGTFLMNELQSLSWFPFFNLRRGNYRDAAYSPLKLAWWCVALPIATFFALFAYYGAGLFAQILAGTKDKRDKAVDEGGTTLTVVDRILDEYVGDVVNYVNSAGRAFYREKGEAPVPDVVQEVFPQIVQRFYEQLVRAHADGCETIQVVAHSLGTVVAYHALSRFDFDTQRPDADSIDAATRKVSRLYTIGSPLEKIRFFWPRIAPQHGHSPNMALRWDNFVSLFDPVSGMLRSFDNWGTVTNHRLLGGGFILGHVVYEHSPVFLGALIEGLCGRRLPFKRGLAGRLWDLLVLAGETLFAPIVLAVVLAAGALLYAMVAMLLPYLASLVVRWFVPAETWGPVVDAASFVLLAMMTLTFLIAPAIRASKAHRRYWVETPDQAPSHEQTR